MSSIQDQETRSEWSGHTIRVVRRHGHTIRVVLGREAIWYNTSSPILLSNIFYTKPDKKITFFRQYSSYFPCQMNRMRNTSREIKAKILHCIYRDCIYVYRRFLKFFKQAGECCYFSNGSFYKLARPLCL